MPDIEIGRPRQQEAAMGEMPARITQPGRRSSSYGRLFRLTPLLVAILVAGLAIVPAPPAVAAEPELVLGRPRFGEYQPIRGDNFLAWQQNTRVDPAKYDVFARALDGGPAFKVNRPRTDGANGGIDGNLLVYQEFTARRSNLRFFDLARNERSKPPAGVNTPLWEYWPSLSGDRLLFGRIQRNGAREVILFDLSMGSSQRLDRVRGRDAFLAPGQVNGDWAAWYRCPRNGLCKAIRYHIPDGSKEVIARERGRVRSPSVDRDGTVYYASSRAGCGNRVTLVRHPLEGPTEELWRLPNGDDVGSTFTYVSDDGETILFFDQYACGDPAAADAWRITEETAPQLTVSKSGDAEGRVTSVPAGIDCGSDCTEAFAQGTGVVLTADPAEGAGFGGWSGDCSGTQLTCSLNMDTSRSVAATFTSLPVLSVTKAGTGDGTVTSVPTGINCGSDCSEPFLPGTMVSLTATAADGSDFVVWSGGGCTIANPCVVTVNASMTVTATFDLEPPPGPTGPTGPSGP